MQRGGGRRESDASEKSHVGASSIAETGSLAREVRILIPTSFWRSCLERPQIGVAYHVSEDKAWMSMVHITYECCMTQLQLYSEVERRGGGTHSIRRKKL